MIELGTLLPMSLLSCIVALVALVIITRSRYYALSVSKAAGGNEVKVRTTRTSYGTTRVLFENLVVLEFMGEHPFTTDFTKMQPMHHYQLKAHPKGHIP